ncbi:hypothetical protein [Amycolatopsis sp. ATCC 39116]|uniref:hypothetical protein n=1 Tax=Amycolatopsis sp. (strain ATCC 39116 / 75iv2) TaxID=385957 RepID=UPI0002625CFC|nr:hypothetical protein [Amycolatopsis sp. ATCC 39116]
MNEQVVVESPANEEETRAALLARQKRDFAPINKLFVQRARGSKSRHGPLSEFVKHRDLRGLQAMLLIIAASSSDSAGDYGTTLPAAVWARAFGTTRTATSASATTAVSKILTRLEQRNLIRRQRVGNKRAIKVIPLREDGSGADYTRPGRGNTDRFLKLPHAYWLDGWVDRLDLPATAMLLVALHEKPGFQLPTEMVPDWYGWSADTAERGFRQLRELGLLRAVTRLKKAPLSPTGLVKVNEYHLLGPFNRLPAYTTLDLTVTPTADPVTPT